MNYQLPFDVDISKELNTLKDNNNLTLVNLGNATAKSFVISKIWNESTFTNIFWTSTEERADNLFLSASFFFDGTIHLIPENVSLRDFYTFTQEIESGKKNLFLFENLTTVLNQKFPSKKEIQTHQITLKKKDEIKIYELFSQLESQGYIPAMDKHLNPGEFLRQGENLFIYPLNTSECIRIELFDNQIENINIFPQHTSSPQTTNHTERQSINIFPAKYKHEGTGKWMDLITGNKSTLFISDDLDEDICPIGNFFKLKFTTFPKEEERFFHLNFFSILPFYTTADFVLEIKERFRRDFAITIATKKEEEIKKIFLEKEIMFTNDLKNKALSTVTIIPLEKEAFIPHSFQNNEKKLLFLTDREIFQFTRSSRQKKAIAGINLDLMTSLKPNDYVIHLDHGIGQFNGIIQRNLGEENGTREYLKLSYAENDKLFVPVESAEKITKFIGDDAPKLNKLGASDWKHAQAKIKKETKRIAAELLKLYAKRALVKGQKIYPDDEMLIDFCESFPYDLTPGQQKTWNDVRTDLEKKRPMDRMVCGDVGFGKTEIAMRAAFKTFRSGYQTAILAPITILAEQHYQNFKKRIEEKNYNIRVELLSRFQSQSEQKIILKDLELGLVDIVIGTHRLLSEDVNIKKLNLLIIDEEQRFGVEQKEKLKKMRNAINILTMTATPIPRTLHMSLNHLKDISTITTPPPGRLPIVTEVRKFNLNLIRERILFEIKRGGQVYFLHNKVQTIESQANQLRTLIPEAKFIVAHGQLSPSDLEGRIRAFKNKEVDVLVASTIIENGIDLPDANTLLVNYAEKFGLSQLYQLRGRVGRRRIQAYSFFLYHGQRLELEAKKRLRAIVEASELGSGFQIAMRDLEIRGAGEILGASQSGAMKTVGVSHFMRMLNKTVTEMKSGEISYEIKEEEAITVEVPLSAYIPTSFIPNTDEKIQIYKEFASAETLDHLTELKKELRDDYGHLPSEVTNLYKVIKLKLILRKINMAGIKINKSSHKSYETVLRMGKTFKPEQIFELVKNSQKKWVITANAIKLNTEKLSINWYEELLEEIKWLTPQN